MSDPTQDRAARRLQFARSALDDAALDLVSASSDASFRSYWRTVGTEPTWIVMDAPPAQEDVRAWLDVARRLRDAAINAPLVRAQDAEQGFLLISDLGTKLYLPELNEDSVEQLYADAMDVLLRLATGTDTQGLDRYDEARLMAELELMPTWFLQRHLDYTPECEEWDVIESAFRILLDNAAAQPRVFVHRDFHSRNLLLPLPDSRDRAPGVIDFQDAVVGPVTYDLVSLLRDCYIGWPDTRVYAWVDALHARLRDVGLVRVDAARFRRWFDLMGMQRHIKVLGIFCRLWYRDGKSGYLADLPRVWNYVRDVGLRYPELAPMVELLQARIGARPLEQVAR